jgi:hypothetical protein
MISEVYADRFRIAAPPKWAPPGTVSLVGEFGDLANACWHEILHNKVNGDPSKPFTFRGKVIRDTHDPAQGGGGLAIGGRFGKPPTGFDLRHLTPVNKQLMGAALTRHVAQYVGDLPVANPIQTNPTALTAAVATVASATIISAGFPMPIRAMSAVVANILPGISRPGP